MNCSVLLAKISLKSVNLMYILLHRFSNSDMFTYSVSYDIDKNVV